jgi:hypothetical protein
MFDIEELKGKIDEAVFTKVKAGFEELSAQRDTARQESIAGRKGKDATIKEQQELLTRYREKLGIEADDELDKLPDAKGQADALKQVDVKLKRLEREKADADKALAELRVSYASEKRDRAIAQAVSKHPFIDADDARQLLSARIRQEGDEIFFEAEPGKRSSVDEGAAWLAKTKLHMLRTSEPGGGAGGFKSGDNNKGSAAGDLGGNREARIAAITARFPELAGLNA